VPNLYPAFERQEVVIHSPQHVRTFAELDDEQVALVAEAWQERIGDDVARVLAFVNEGRLAGASLPHSHSQLVWTKVPAERLERLPELLEPFEVARRGGVIAAVHPLGAGPYECLIAATAADSALADGLVLLRDLVRRLHDAEGSRPWNAWLHPGPPWHLHFVPRLTALAGIELGARIYVNVVPPEQAAERLAALRNPG
jgi:UDPglucose--hexose-1-phosphate uridylyltransferase